MDIPSKETRPPSPLIFDLTGIDPSVTELSIHETALGIELLHKFKNLISLWIGKVSASTAADIAELPSLIQLAVHKWNLPDLLPLANLHQLNKLTIVNSSKLKSLAGIEKFTNLRTLIFFSNCNYTDLTPLAKLTSLETLCIEGGFSKPVRINSLTPLANLTSLHRLRLASIRVKDKSLEPLSNLTNLRDVFIAKMFPSSELRNLAVVLPLANGEFLNTFRAK